MKRKGFTLIELLTVIIVITIISLITVPIILNVIESARKASFKDSILIAHKSVDLKLYELKLDELPDEGIEVKDLNIKSKFKSGKFIKNELGKTISYFITDGEYCAYGEIRNLKIEKGCQNLDITGPVLDESKLILTSSSSEIKVNILEGFAIDNESGIKSYKVNLYKDNKIIETKELKEIGEIIFNKLTTGIEYKLEIMVSNKKGLEESLNKSIVTKIIDTPTYSIDKSGWSQSKTVTINYPSGYTNEYSLDSGLTWNTYTTPITFTSNGTVIGRVTDGTNYITGSSQTITEIDTTAPITTISIGNKTTDSITLNTTCTDEESGITKIEYSKDNGSTFVPGTPINLWQSERMNSHLYKATRTIINDSNYPGVTVYKHSFDSTATSFGGPYYIPAEKLKVGKKYTWSVYIKVNKEKFIYYFGSEQDGKLVTTFTPEWKKYTKTFIASESSVYAFALYAEWREGDELYMHSLEVYEEEPQVSEYTFSNLKTNTNYQFESRCTNGSGMTSTEKISETTKLLGTPTYSVTPSSWSTSKTVTINYPSGYTNEYSLDSGLTWKSYTTPITFTSNGSIIARVTDGTNYVTGSSQTVTQVDSIAPTTPTVKYNSGSNTCTWKNNYNITLTSTAASGIAYYEIDHNNDGVADLTTSSNFIPHNAYSSCTNRFRSVSNSGLRSDWTATHHIHMDTVKPEHTKWWWGTVTKDVAKLYIQATDNIGFPTSASTYDGHGVGVYCPTSTASGGHTNWYWFGAVWDSSANAYRCDITPSTFGHYNQTYLTHLYIYDYAGNGGYYNATSIVIPAKCTYNVGQRWEYEYNGGIQTFTTPCTGTYKLEVWGAQGGNSYGVGGLGGYSTGNIALTEKNPLYVGIGGQGSGFTGGYNGGANGFDASTWLWQMSGGGGATHIATTNRGPLYNYESYKSEVRIVAGGGGGGTSYRETVASGHGGGTAGGGGAYRSDSSSAPIYYNSTGGTQTQGGYVGGEKSNVINGSFGGGGSYGGGAGWYGGGGGGTTSYIVYSPSGGSGYIGGVTGGTTSNAKRNGNGLARITLVSIS